MKHIYFILISLALIGSLSAQKKKKKNKPSTQEAVVQPAVQSGFIDYTYDEPRDRLYFLIDKLDEEFIYVSSLSSGLGSNKIAKRAFLGLDRGQLNPTKRVKFVKMGNKIMLIEPNYKFRATSDNSDEVIAVEQAFASSILWGFAIVSDVDGVYKVDATDFVMRDSHDVVSALQQSGQGNYKLDISRSALNLARTKTFPENSEFDAIVTFVGQPTGHLIHTVTPSAEAITLSVHHSFVKAPAPGFEMRGHDPRAGYFGIDYKDFASPIGTPITQRFISRHRLEKKDPSIAQSEAVEPIIYYLDRGAPEPIKSALMEGAAWWNQAFEAIGFTDAFQVKVLPEGIDPMDARYNIIQWVHRNTRGWSYGGGIIDPLTGEIIKGHVSLGSQRVRQDYLIAEGLLSPYGNEDEGSDVMEQMSLARLRQLAAHEVGHTLGLAHSYASSSEGRASVMDYPHPLVELVDGQISLDHAYDDKIGVWDKVAIAYGYTVLSDSKDPKAALDQIIRQSLDSGLTFLSDAAARPAGGSHPFAHLWDNGKNAYEGLNHLMKVRGIALDNMGENSIKTGTPYAMIEEVFVPVYFLHRYQIEANAKLIGGRNYRYALKGDGQLVLQSIPGAVQLNSLNALLSTVQPKALAIPEQLLDLMPPRPLGYSRSNELVRLRTAPNFDAISAAETAADMVFSLLLNPSRASRLIENYSRDNSQLGLDLVLKRMMDETWRQAPVSGYLGEIQNVINLSMLTHTMELAVDDRASVQAKAHAYQTIIYMESLLSQRNKKFYSRSKTANYNYALKQIALFFADPDEFKGDQSLEIPAGSPIGMGNRCE